MAVSISKLTELRDNLALARIGLAESKSQVDEILEHVSIVYADKFASLDAAKDEVARCDEALRAAAVEYFVENKEKHPIKGVNINDSTVIEYDPKEALKWSVEHQVCLSLDAKAFEALAKAGTAGIPANVTLQPKASIGTKLEVGM